jgi:alpha-L-arabinofuranosidase
MSPIPNEYGYRSDLIRALRDLHVPSPRRARAIAT